MAPQVGRTAEAAAGFRAAISVQPDGAEAYYNLGIAYKDQGRHRDSLDAYHAALALRPTFPEASFNAGRALQMLTDEPGPLGLLRPGLHAARTAALQHISRISPAYLPSIPAYISRTSPL